MNNENEIKNIREKLKIIDNMENLNKEEKRLLRKYTLNSISGFPKSIDIIDCNISSLYPDMWKIDNNISYKELYEKRLEQLQDKGKE